MLTAFQERLARRFFELPESAGFALAGGAALVLRRLVDRTTKDLDLFVAEEGVVGYAADAFVAVLRSEGLDVEVHRRSVDFAKLEVRDGDDACLVDLGRDWQWDPSTETDLVPVLSDRELAVNKLLALFGRAAARDFVDVSSWPSGSGSISSSNGRRRDRYPVDDATYDEMTEWYRELRARLLKRE